MPDAIKQSFVTQYGTTIHMDAQQKGSRLLSTVSQEQGFGEAGWFDTLGAFTANEYATREDVGGTSAPDTGGERHADTPINDTPHDKRQIVPRDFDWGTLIDNFDKVRMLIDPLSRYNMNAVAALGRKIDGEIIRAAVGAATSRANGSVALPAGQIVATQPAVTLNVLEEVELRFNQAEVEEEDRIFVTNAQGWRELHQIEEFKNSDYNGEKPLSSMNASTLSKTFSTLTFIRSELIPAASTAIAYQRQGILFAQYDSITAEIAKDPTKRYGYRPYFCMTGGAVRMEEARVINVTVA